ncbi:MAG: ABC transporter substrate-binding protein [Sedimentibacter sp.]|uniref:ABC transporter substrate-binding protein n=1 Tax=Sedimentibacter sp. TaxID=1960295 RepID=UPI003158BC08
MKKIISIILAAAMLFVMTSCSNQQNNSNQQAEKPVKTSLTMGYTTEPEGLDPQRTAAASTFSVTNNIYDTLVGVTSDWQIIPRLAKEWTISEDGMEISFVLRDDVYFHNGRQMTAKDVEFSFNRLKDAESPKAKDYANIVKIEAIDNLNIKFTTETLDVELLKRFAYPWTAVVPEEAADSLKTAPVGTGAFKLKEWTPQQNLILERNEKYYGEAPSLETVKFVLIPDATTMMASFQVGDLDIIPLTGDQVTLIEGNAEYQIISQPMNAVQIMSLNTDNEILSNQKVRQAMAMAINKDEVIEASMFGYGDKIGSHLPPTSPDYYDTNDLTPYNPEKAKELLKEAGYENGFDITLTLPKNYQLHVDAGQVIADQLSKIGINVKIELVEWGTWLSDVYGAKKFDMTVVGHTGRLDSYAFLARYKSDSNDYISLKTGEVDQLLADAMKELDENKRKEIYKEIQVILAEQLPAVYLQTPRTMLALQKNVEGMEIFPIDVYDFRGVSFTE